MPSTHSYRIDKNLQWRWRKRRDAEGNGHRGSKSEKQKRARTQLPDISEHDFCFRQIFSPLDVISTSVIENYRARIFERRLVSSSALSIIIAASAEREGSAFNRVINKRRDQSLIGRKTMPIGKVISGKCDKTGAGAKGHRYRLKAPDIRRNIAQTPSF